MAYFSLHAYDADVWLREFKGLNQMDESLNTDPRYATEVMNMETPGGVLQPSAGYDQVEGEFEDRVETLAKFHRRWYTGHGSKEWYVCCSGGLFYYRQADSQTPWSQIAMPSGIDAFEKSAWSYVTYEINNPDADNVTVDVLLLSNDTDGMIMIVPPDAPTTYGDLEQFTHQDMALQTHEELQSPAWSVQTVDTKGYKFGVIERYAERVWGGAIQNEPDLLVYSAPYDPTDWEANTEIPEDGAGDVRQPSWDGDKFYALKKFGDQLLAFKKNRVWRVLGVSPGEYTFQEQHSTGTEYPNTIAVEGERAYFASRDGMMVYDGMSSSPYAQEAVNLIWDTVNKSALSQMTAVIHQNRYYLAFPVDGSEINNAMLVYNMTDRTILYYPDFHVESFLPTDDELFFTTSSAPGKVFRMGYDSWKEGKSSGAATRWVSPWMDFGYKRIQKGGFELYFLAEVQTEPVTLKFSIQTEKKTKSKTYTVYPVNLVKPKSVQLWENVRLFTWDSLKEKTWGQISGKVDETPRSHKDKRLHFGGTGRRFRLIVETEEGNTNPWRLIGGLHLVVETDPD